MAKIIELNTNEYFNDMICENVIEGLLANGYTLYITPCKYSNNKHTMMVEINGIDESFIPPVETNIDETIT